VNQIKLWLALAVLPLVVASSISRIQWPSEALQLNPPSATSENPQLASSNQLASSSQLASSNLGAWVAPAAIPTPLDTDRISPLSSLAGRDDSTLLVQEPGKRSALRPDYSSAFRNSNFRNNFFMLQAFKEALGGCRESTVRLICDGNQCALGTIVDSEGWIVTKASELDLNYDIDCLLSDQREFRAEVVNTFVDLDVALLRIPVEGLAAVEWEYEIPDQGKWLATTDSQSEIPAAIGVVSAGAITVPSQRAVLGVELAPDDPSMISGAKVRHVLSGSGAYLAGLQKEDIIVALDGKQITSRDQLLSMLRGGKGGQFLKLAVYRDEDTIEKKVRLMDLSMELLDETEMEVNGPISARASGFKRIFMHDTVLQPNQCGGPLVNLDGKAVGINIARAGRVSTYALPADTIRQQIYGVIQQAKLVSTPSPLRALKASLEIPVPETTVAP
jgi:serine protease Do